MICAAYCRTLYAVFCSLVYAHVKRRPACLVTKSALPPPRQLGCEFAEPSLASHKRTCLSIVSCPSASRGSQEFLPTARSMTDDKPTIVGCHRDYDSIQPILLYSRLHYDTATTSPALACHASCHCASSFFPCTISPRNPARVRFFGARLCSFKLIILRFHHERNYLLSACCVTLASRGSARRASLSLSFALSRSHRGHRFA